VFHTSQYHQRQKRLGLIQTALSDVEAGTHKLPISGAGESPFKVGDSIMARAFERGELPA